MNAVWHGAGSLWPNKMRGILSRSKWSPVLIAYLDVEGLSIEAST